jgi:hypothetical protein
MMAILLAQHVMDRYYQGIDLLANAKPVRQMMRAVLTTVSALGVVATTFLCSSPTVRADDYISPDLVKVTTPFYKPGAVGFKPRLGVYEYSVGWEGITAASCAVTISKRDNTYVIDAAARTYSGVDLLYKLRYDAIGVISAKDFTSMSLSIDHRENSRQKTIELSFQPEQGTVSAIRGKGVIDPEKKHLSFDPNNMTLDPVGAVFLARSLDWEIGETKHFDVFNGKSRYFISLTAAERTTIDYKGEQRKVIAITPQVRNLTTTKPKSKLRQAFIYVSDDENREVLKIVSSVFIGSVTVELESFAPLPEKAAPIQMAKANADEATVRAQLRPSAAN